MAPVQLPNAVKGRARTCGYRDKLAVPPRSPAQRTRVFIMGSHTEKGLEMSERGQSSGLDGSAHAQAPPRLSKADRQKTKIDLMKVRAVRSLINPLLRSCLAVVEMFCRNEAGASIRSAISCASYLGSSPTR